jgi:hypothetical protein
MKIIERERIYNKFIEISNDDFHLAKQGKKKCTIRLGRVKLLGENFFLLHGANKIKIKVIQIDDTRVFGSLTDEDAQLEGFQAKEELINDLQQYYGKLDRLQPISIIYFETIND